MNITKASMLAQIGLRKFSGTASERKQLVELKADYSIEFQQKMQTIKSPSRNAWAFYKMLPS